MPVSGQNADAKPLDDSYILNGGKTGTESVRFSVYKKPLSPPSAPAAGSKTVTVSFICTAQEGSITPGCESLTVEKGTPWKNIKPYAESICTPKLYRNIEKWQSGTADIPDDYLITENTVLTAVLRDNRISLRFSVYTSGSNSPHLKIKTDHLTVQNGTAWKHIKDKILAGINPIEGYENYGLDKITPGSADAKPITDDFVFKRDESNEYNLYIHEKKTKHILTIEYDSGISGAEPGVIYADINAKWGSVKAEASGKLKIHEYYSFKEWRIEDVKGTALTDDYEFIQNTNIYAKTRGVSSYIKGNVYYFGDNSLEMKDIPEVKNGTIGNAGEIYNPVHTVNLSAYQISTEEITEGWYNVLMKNNREAEGNLPKTGMTWYDAVAFCNELTKMLSSLGEKECIYTYNAE